MKHRRVIGVEFWRWAWTDRPARHDHECWLWSDGRWLHKHFFRVGGHVYAFAWFARRGRSHFERRRPVVTRQ